MLYMWGRVSDEERQVYRLTSSKVIYKLSAAN
jgi:hypothetical protein